MTPTATSPHVDDRAAVQLVLQMLAIPGKSGMESKIAEFIVGQLRAAGVPQSAIAYDQAHKKSHVGGEIGNLIVKLPGTTRAPRRLLMGHMDTVPLCVGAQPVRQGRRIVSRDKTTALGGDNRAGAGVVLNAALTILKHKLPHPPLTLFWPVQEEIGLVGARHVAAAKLGGPKLCFNWDGGSPSAVVIGATGGDSLDIRIHGLASHAGAHPEDGISAVAIAGKAVADLTDNGWHGLVRKGKHAGTSNIGFVAGGEATNVVTDLVTLRAEARSHDPQFRAKIVAAYAEAFRRAAKSVTSNSGAAGSVDIDVHHKYESFRLSLDEPSVRSAMSALRACGLEPEPRIINGGLDANWLTAHGLPTVTLGCGQAGIHTVKETLDVDQYLQACRIGLLLATGGEP
ncbi:MAG: M20/M25/M40 family metallo-hydrolase [Planctomycetaceae bacterium]|nr:M20/M25/M40 family metallo-hydrolase [Planctomycetaceae bacterium]